LRRVVFFRQHEVLGRENFVRVERRHGANFHRGKIPCRKHELPARLHVDQQHATAETKSLELLFQTLRARGIELEFLHHRHAALARS
jgi:hypothetical protein